MWSYVSPSVTLPLLKAVLGCFFFVLLRPLFASNVVSKHSHTSALSGTLTLGIPAPVPVTLLVCPASIESSSFQQPLGASARRADEKFSRERGREAAQVPASPLSVYVCVCGNLRIIPWHLNEACPNQADPALRALNTAGMIR